MNKTKLSTYKHYWNKPEKCACGANAVIIIDNEEKTIEVKCKRNCGVWTGYINYDSNKPLNSEMYADSFWHRAVFRRECGIE